MTDIEVVVPVLDEEEIIPELVRRLSAALGGAVGKYRITIVDDGSTDGTWQAICDASDANPSVRGIRFSRNFGQHVAISAGLDVCDADWVVVMDGDLQDRPEVIPELYAKAREGYDIVFVARQERPEGRLYKMAQSVFYHLLQYLSQTDYNPAFGNFSIISRQVAEEYRRLPEGQRFYGGLIFWLGFRRGYIDAQHGEREAGAPSYTLRRRIRFAVNIIVAHSLRPLHAAIFVGTLSTLISFGFGVYIILRALFGDFAVQGWASLMVSIYFVGGIIMTLLGMNSLYLGKVYSELKRRPMYVVSDRAGNGDDG